MATFNEAHHATGGVVLFNGELILLFCDDVHVTISNTNQSETGRLYLTTHRLIFTSKSMKSSLKSFSAPFYSMHDLTLEQPIFGANYIKGKVNDSQTQNQITFKLKFNHGGCIEYGQALRSAAQVTQQRAQSAPFQAPPPYTPSASQYYEAPPNVYQPAYNCGFPLPTTVFNQAPPAGFIYTSDAPPPYPGLTNSSSGPSAFGAYPPNTYNPPVSTYPVVQPNSGYPPNNSVYPPPPTAAPYVPGVYNPPVSTYPSSVQPTPGYPSNPGGFSSPYPPQTSGPGYPSIPGAPYQNAPQLGFNVGEGAPGPTAPYPDNQPANPYYPTKG